MNGISLCEHRKANLGRYLGQIFVLPSISEVHPHETAFKVIEVLPAWKELYSVITKSGYSEIDQYRKCSLIICLTDELRAQSFYTSNEFTS